MKIKPFRTKISSYGGVYPIPLYTKPSNCGGSCVFCPKTNDIPNSYILNEDTIFAKDVDYSVIPQFDRFTARINNYEGYGIPLEIIILGGSFSALSRKYRMNFMANLYGHIDNLCRNNIATFLCSIVSIEARPDHINPIECNLLRELGISKVEMGIQHVNDDILRCNKRGHSIKDVIFATSQLKDSGFKVGYHVMLGLPGATYEDDLRMLSETIWRHDLSPDFLKIYPCELLRDRRYQPDLWNLYESGYWQPPNKEYITRLLFDSGASIPQTVRISRIMRQFDENDVLFPRPTCLHNKIKSICKCIRCREAGLSNYSFENDNLNDYRINRINISNKDVCIQVIYNEVLIALARVRRLNKKISILRELHVYGPSRNLGTPGVIQGKNIGSKLLENVENMLISEGQNELLINVAIGARGFFMKKGYVINEEGYMQKKINLQIEQSTGRLSKQFSRKVSDLAENEISENAG